MTVADLIAELSKVKNKSLRVYMEGCDCFGELRSVVEDTEGVDLLRSERA